MNDSDSKSIACSDELMFSFDGPCFQNYPTVSEIVFCFWNYTPSVPKEVFVVPLRPNKSPWWKIPFSKGSLLIMCERNVLEVLLQRRWRKNCIEPGKPSGASWFFTILFHPQVLHLLWSARCFKINLLYFTWEIPKKMWELKSYTFPSNDFYDLPSNLKTCFAGCRCHQLVLFWM